MPARDFFSFCTSLRPIELKALGALSQVRHLPEAETIYSAGDKADALYIVNRGVVEIAEVSETRGGTGTYLSRGDVFGDLELLTETPRKHRARTCEDVSLQCFQHAALPELLQTVPAFFRFLCDQLAYRLVQARDAAGTQTHRLELSGTLGNFDLVTIYQTIMNSAQTGELSILRESGEVLAVFSFDAGRPCGGQFEHLSGEEAFAQLFQTADLRGTFSFASGASSIHILEPAWVDRNPEELLITALQARDEVDALRAMLPDKSAVLKPQRTHLDLAIANAGENGPLLGQIWERTSGRRTLFGDIYPQFLVSELKIYRAIYLLVKTGHLAFECSALPQKVA